MRTAPSEKISIQSKKGLERTCAVKRLFVPIPLWCAANNTTNYVVGSKSQLAY